MNKYTIGENIMDIKKMTIDANVETTDDVEILLETLEVARKGGSVVTLVIKQDYETFCTELGKHLAKMFDVSEIIKLNSLTKEDAGINTFIGKMVLSQAIPTTYFVRDDHNMQVLTIKA